MVSSDLSLASLYLEVAAPSASPYEIWNSLWFHPNSVVTKTRLYGLAGLGWWRFYIHTSLSGTVCDSAKHCGGCTVCIYSLGVEEHLEES